MHTYLINLSPAETDLSPYNHIFYEDDHNRSCLTVLSFPEDRLDKCIESIKNAIQQESTTYYDYNIIVYSRFCPRDTVPDVINDRLCDVICQEKTLVVRVLNKLKHDLFIHELSPEKLLFIFGEACSHGLVQESRESIANLSELQKHLWRDYILPCVSTTDEPLTRRRRSIQAVPAEIIEELNAVLPDNTAMNNLTVSQLRSIYSHFTNYYTHKMIFSDSTMTDYCAVQYSYLELSSNPTQYRRDLFQLIAYANAFAREKDPLPRNWEKKADFISRSDPLTQEAIRLPDVDFKKAVPQLFSGKIQLLTKQINCITTGCYRKKTNQPVPTSANGVPAEVKDQMRNALEGLQCYLDYKELRRNVNQYNPDTFGSQSPASAGGKLKALSDQLSSLQEQNKTMQNTVHEYLLQLTTWYSDNKVSILHSTFQPYEVNLDTDCENLDRQIISFESLQREHEDAFMKSPDYTHIPNRIDDEIEECQQRIRDKETWLSRFHSLLPLVVIFPLLVICLVWLHIRDRMGTAPGTAILISLAITFVCCAIAALLRKKWKTRIGGLLRNAENICRNFYQSWQQVCSSVDNYQRQLSDHLPNCTALEESIRKLKARKEEVLLQEHQENWHQKKMQEYIGFFKNILDSLGLPIAGNVNPKLPVDFSPKTDHEQNNSTYGFSDDDILHMFVLTEGET